MAYARLAIVKGEWRMGPDSVIRLFIAPTIEINNKPGDVVHVSAFATAFGRSDDPFEYAPYPFFCPAANTSYSFGGKDENTPGYKTLNSEHVWHNLGSLMDDDYYPTLGMLCVKSNIVWQPLNFCADYICLSDACLVSEYDEPLLNLLKRIKNV